MFGWRKRIGYIAPTVIEVVAYEFYRSRRTASASTGVTCNIDDWRPDEFEKGLAQVTAAATYLGSRGVDFIIHGGGPLVVARGAGYEEIIVKESRPPPRSRRPPRVRAGMEALRHIGARRIAIASPYPERHNDALTGHLTTTASRSSAPREWICRSRRCRTCRPPTSGHLPATCWPRAKDCDALYLPCPQWQAAQIVEELEQDSGKPVVAYTHACFFVAFKTMGMNDAIRGHGRLLASLANA